MPGNLTIYMQALDGIGRIDDFADLFGISKKGGSLAPRRVANSGRWRAAFSPKDPRQNPQAAWPPTPLSRLHRSA
jgi:hypothetical protein